MDAANGCQSIKSSPRATSRDAELVPSRCGNMYLYVERIKMSSYVYIYDVVHYKYTYGWNRPFLLPSVSSNR